MNYHKVKKIVRYILFVVNKPIQRFKKIDTAYITCAGNNDGVGAQVHAILSTMLFAELYGLEYVHTPFVAIQHNVNNVKNWEAQWESFFSFGSNKKLYSDINIYVNKNKAVKHALLLSKTERTLFIVRNCHECTDLVPDKYGLILPELKKNFHLKYAKNIVKQASVKRIALHIRRGDVTQSGINADRYTDPSLIIKLLDQVVDFFNNHNISFQIEIYSLGVIADFKEFEKFSVRYRLNENEADTFLGLVNADILLMAKSSFSYTAALLSDGLVFYDRFWHPPLSSWLVYKEMSSQQINYELKSFLNINE